MPGLTAQWRTRAHVVAAIAVLANESAVAGAATHAVGGHDPWRTSPPTMQEAITSAVLPILKNASINNNNSAWNFAYKDADLAFSICAGYSNIEEATPCTVQDHFAWGSTTKTQTSTRLLQLVEQGKLALDDGIIERADPFLKRTSGGKADLVSLFGPMIHNVTLRHLLQMQSGLQEYDNPTIRHYQNSHRTEDLTPLWIMQNANRSFICAPGSCGRYSSLNYVILGLVLAQATGAADWDKLDQAGWQGKHNSTDLPRMYYGDHGLLSSFTTATGRRSSTISGYQPGWPHTCHVDPEKPSRHTANCVATYEADVKNMSSTQGWTCGNLVTSADQVAEFFWDLLGQQSFLKPETMKEMLGFQSCQYFGGHPVGCQPGAPGQFGYGLGMMNFTSMNWGFEKEGTYYGHNGLTYGFGSQSGYHYPLKFSASWVNNIELWIGHDHTQPRGTQNTLYTALCAVVRKYRAQQDHYAEQQ